MASSSSTLPVATITGGGGYVGLRLAKKLIREGYRVQLFDVTQPKNLSELLELPDGEISQGEVVSFIVGDIRNATDVGRIVRDTSASGHGPVDVVFHIASYGMSGEESLKHEYIEQVNVKGTELVLAACIEAGVPRLVYTSTYNVVFHGQVIVNGDESYPYVDVDGLYQKKDVYSATKAQAEKLVLAADKPDVMRTCAIRPAGIYGPGERRHLPRTIGMVRAGLFQFVFGPADSLVDWVHVENMCKALYLASQALRPEQKCIAGGEAYFISDDKPINNFEFMRPIITGLGYSFPFIRLPYGMMYNIAALMGAAHIILARVGIHFVPLLSCAEVNKCAVTHYFSMEKARRQLGYQADNYPISETVAWFKENGYGANSDGKSMRSSILVLVLMGMVLLLLPTILGK